MEINTIFIIGQHRTGSTWLKNVLNANSEVTMAFDEMNLFEPFRKDTLNIFLDHQNITADQLSELILQGKIYGTFWQKFEQSGIALDDVKQQLKKKRKLTSVSVIQTILRLLRKKNNAKISGVKYPLHFRKVDYLLDHFPDSAVLFITRNPKAMISSKLNDEATKKRKETTVVHRLLVHYFTLIYFSIEYIFSVKMYLKNRDRLMLVTYENLVSNTRKTLEDICITCGIPFEEEMLLASGKSSSYKFDSKNGVHAQSMRKYEEMLNTFDIFLIDFFTNRYHKKIIHESGSHI